MTKPTEPVDELEAKLHELKKQMSGRHHADLHVYGDWGEHIYEADWLTYLPNLITADRKQLLDRMEKEVIGEDEFEPVYNPNPSGHEIAASNTLKSRDNLRRKERTALAKLRKELGL